VKYLEIKPGLNVNKNQIIYVEDIDMMTCKIYTAVGSLESIYPSWRILMQLEQEDIQQQPVAPETPKDRVNLWGQQYFAG